MKEIVVVVPPTDFGGYNTDILAACHELGITEIYRVGGAQAVAALAYGVEGIERVDKIVGPGNLFVASLNGTSLVKSTSTALPGPSEVIVLADETANAEFIASDLISQAEHSPGSGVMITWHEPLIEAVRTALINQLNELPRGDLARQSLLDYGALILARDEDEAAAIPTCWPPSTCTSRPPTPISNSPKSRTPARSSWATIPRSQQATTTPALRTSFRQAAPPACERSLLDRFPQA